MKVLSQNELSQLLGGGYWKLLPDGTYIYVEFDEEGDDDDIVYGW